MAYQQVTLTQAQQLLADRYESVPYWTPEEARIALNEALHLYSAATGFWKKTFQTVTVPNDPFVALPGTLVQGSRVTWNGIPLEYGSVFELDQAFPNWRGQTTASPGAPNRPVYWARFSLSLLAIYPADANPTIVTAGANALLVDGVRDTPVLLRPTDFIDIGQEEFNTLLGYAQHVLAFKVGGETLVKSYPAWQAFLKACAAKNEQFAATAYYRRAMGLDQQRRFHPPSANVTSAADQAAQDAAQAGS